MMKTLNQKELEQVAGGYRWSDFRKDWKDFWKEMGKGLIDENIIVVKTLRI